MQTDIGSTARRVSRRAFLRLALAGAGIMSVPVLASCSSAAPAAPTQAPAATSAPAAAPATASAATAAPAPTAAPATTAAAPTSPPTAAPTAAAAAAPTTASAPTAAAPADVAFTNPGASQAAPVSVARQGGTLIIGSGGAFEQTDPMRVYDVQNLLTLRLFTGALLEHDDQLRPLPGVMDRWAISEDGRTYTFHLRDGAKWTNGRAITIEDIQWNMNRIVDLRGISGSGPSFAFLEKSEIKLLDKSTIQMTLSQPYSPFLAALTSGYSLFLIAPESPQTDDVVTLPIGTGPYELLEYRPKELLRLRLFKDNWHGITEGFEEIEIRNMSDNSVRINALRAGDVDLINLVPESEIERLKTQETDRIETLISQEGIFWWFMFNHTRPPFDDLRVRKAAQLAHDAAQMADAVTLGNGSGYEQPFVSRSPWHFDGVEVPRRNLEEARRLLAEAGYPNGLPVKLMLSSSWYTSLGTAAQVLQAQLAEAGFQIELEDMEFGAFNDRGFKTDFEMSVNGWDVEPWDPDDYYYNCWHPKGIITAFLGGGYDNPTVSDLLDKARLETSFEGRKALYRDVERTLQEDAAGIFSYRLSLGYAWGTHLTGFKTTIRGDFAYRSGGIHSLTRV